MRRNKNAKIIATLGPASDDRATIEALFEAGADVFRLNFSHGIHEDHRRRLDTDPPDRTGQRPAYRCPARPAGAEAAHRHLCRRPGDAGRRALRSASISTPERRQRRARRLPHPEIFAALKAGTNLLLDDGKIALARHGLRPRLCRDACRRGGALSDRKGVNVPDVVLPLSAMTDKDRADLDFGLKLGDRLGRAVVRAAARGHRRSQGHRRRVAPASSPNWRSPRPSRRLEAIVAETDAVMVARGDLGVEMPAEQVPSHPEADRARLPPCRQAGHRGHPDARIDGRCAGADARRGVRRGHRHLRRRGCGDALGRIGQRAVSARGGADDEQHHRAHRERPELSRRDRRVTHRAAAVAADAIGLRTARVRRGCCNVAATVAYTSSGYSALRMARERPRAPIIGMTPRLATARRLALVWGVHAVLCHDVADVPEMSELACRTALREGFGKVGADHRHLRRHALRHVGHHQSPAHRADRLISFPPPKETPMKHLPTRPIASRDAQGRRRGRGALRPGRLCPGMAGQADQPDRAIRRRAERPMCWRGRSAEELSQEPGPAGHRGKQAWSRRDAGRRLRSQVQGRRLHVPDGRGTPHHRDERLQEAALRLPEGPGARQHRRLVPNVLVVNPGVPAKNVAELLALAKAQPGKLALRFQRQRHGAST